jgi:cell division inhibitor SepF
MCTMSTMWQKTLIYLGLVEEAEDLPEHERLHAPAAPPRRAGAAPVRVTPMDRDTAGVTRINEPGSAHVRPVGSGSAARAAIVTVESFADVQPIGTRLREFQPVVVDTSHVEGPEAKRVLDFVSGVTFALGGRLEPLGPRVFLALPDGRELGAGERDRIAEMGYARQHA